ncbi:MAG: glycoside hydrolase family 15 protein [Myxococcota bacterium]
MDLYSLSRRIERPFVFKDADDGRKLPISGRGIIGDGFSAALVRADGAIDWLCLPRFDSPSVFGAMLDHERGGITRLGPAKAPYESLQRYDPDTNVLETLFRVEGQGVLRLTDFMPWTNDPRASVHEVHRRLECVEGTVDVSAVFDPRFGYGAGNTKLDVQEHGVLAQGEPGENLVAVLQDSSDWSARAAGGVECLFTLRAGQRRWMVLSWGAPEPEPLAAYRPFQHLRSTRHFWREWTRSITYDGPWRHHVMRSALLLKLLIYAPSGAMVAAPTTSLPEWIGGVRNWDYRYTWTRDTAMAIRAANLVGCGSEARDFFHFVRDTLDNDQSLQVMYAVDGQRVPDERTLSHLRGFADSAPVRVGNGARDQVQLDTVGALIDAAYLYERFEQSLSLRAWRRMRGVLDDVYERWTQPDHGIWEPRGDPRHNVHSKLMSWLALDRGAQLAELFGDRDYASSWARSAEDVHTHLRANGLDSKRRHFVTAYGIEEPDAALLLMPIHGFMDPAHPLMTSTVDWIRAELGTGPFLHRYRMDDGVGGDEGAFVLCGFWLAEALALGGRLEEAMQVFTAHADASNHLGLLAEELDPISGVHLGNFPQAFSHLGLINAALRIDSVLRRRDEGGRRGERLNDQPPSRTTIV